MINKEQRYKLLIIDFIKRPVLPAPFIILTFIGRIISTIFEFCTNKLIQKFKKPKDSKDVEKGSDKTLPKKKEENREDEFAKWSKKMVSSFFSENIKKWK